MSQGTRQAAGRLPGDSPRCFLASSSPVVCMCPGFTATKKTRPQIKGSYLWIEWNTHCSRVEQAWVFLYAYMHTALRHFQFGFVCRLLATGKPQPDLLHYVCAATTSIDSNLPHVPVAIKKLLNEVWTSAVSVKKKDYIGLVELLEGELFVLWLFKCSTTFSRNLTTADTGAVGQPR